MKRILLVIGLILFLNFLGKTQNAQKVVSLAPSLTKNIYLLAAEDKLVACTSYCKEGIKDNKEIAGSAVNVNIEKIVSLQPDLVLATKLTKSQDIETIKSLGIRIEVLPTPKNLDEIYSQFIKISEMLGKKQLAESIVQNEKVGIKELQSLVLEKVGNKRIFFQIGVKPIYSVLPNTFMDDYITLTGNKNIAVGLNKGTLSREAVVSFDPEVIIITTMGIVGEHEKQEWLAYKELTAVKNNKVFIIESDIACTATPVNFSKALRMIFNFIYN